MTSTAVSDDPFAGLSAEEALEAMVDQAIADIQADEAQYSPAGLRYPTTDELNGGPVRADLPMLKPRLPAARSNVERTTLQSADLEVRTCRHELAAALAIFSGEDPVLAEVPPRYFQVADRLFELIALFPKCGTKGVA